MKKLLFKRVFGLCLMLAVFTNGVWASTDGGTTFDELSLGDWFVLKQTEPSDRVDKEFSTTWRGTIINRTEQDVTVEFVLMHLFEQTINSEGARYYIDTYFDFTSYLDGEENQKLVLDPPKITMKRSLIATGIPNIEIQLSDSIRRYVLEDYLHGLVNNREGFLRQYLHTILETTEIADKIKSIFKQNELTSLPNLALTEASFKLKPNALIFYHSNDKKKDHRLTITNSYSDPTPDSIGYMEQKDKHTYIASLHLGSPAKIVIDGIELWLSPDDSLVVTKDKKGEVHFSGKGAEICNVAYWLNKYERDVNVYGIYMKTSGKFPEVFSKEDLLNCIAKIEDLYAKHLYPNKSKIDPYWFQSAKLSLDYIKGTIILGPPYMTGAYKKINDWNQSPMDLLCPILDYRYKPLYYEDFIEAFYFHNSVLLNRSTLTDKMYGGEDRETFYLIKQLFYGYPRAILWLENIDDRLYDGEKISNLNEEITIFYEDCFDPYLQNKVKKMESYYEQFEDGKNIKQANLDFIKHIPLKEKSDGYILLSASHFFENKDLAINADVDTMLMETNLIKEVKQVYIRPYDRNNKVGLDSVESAKYGYVWIKTDGLGYHDTWKFFAPELLFILRSDGTIVGRTSFHSVDEIKEIILKDKEECAQAPLFSRNQLYGALGILVVVILIVGVYYNSRIRKQQLQTRFSQLKLKAIRSQMNPHFIFNALTSIQSLILRSDTERANDYLTTFSYMLRNVLTSSEKTLIPLSDELELVEQYLQIEQLRMAIDYHLEVASDICTDEVEIPGMLLQPIVENAVIHGLFPQHGGKIDIRLWIENNNLCCEIVDNGVGIKNNSDNKSKFGLYSIEERLTLLNHSKASQVKLSVVNRADEEQVSGCKIKIMIPL